MAGEKREIETDALKEVNKREGAWEKQPERKWASGAWRRAGYHPWQSVCSALSIVMRPSSRLMPKYRVPESIEIQPPQHCTVGPTSTGYAVQELNCRTKYDLPFLHVFPLFSHTMYELKWFVVSPWSSLLSDSLCRWREGRYLSECVWRHQHHHRGS